LLIDFTSNSLFWSGFLGISYIVDKTKYFFDATGHSHSAPSSAIPHACLTGLTHDEPPRTFMPSGVGSRMDLLGHHRDKLTATMTSVDAVGATRRSVRARRPVKSYNPKQQAPSLRSSGSENNKKMRTERSSILNLPIYNLPDAALIHISSFVENTSKVLLAGSLDLYGHLCRFCMDLNFILNFKSIQKVHTIILCLALSSKQNVLYGLFVWTHFFRTLPLCLLISS
jgi:hypothetical protein